MSTLSFTVSTRFSASHAFVLRKYHAPRTWLKPCPPCSSFMKFSGGVSVKGKSKKQAMQRQKHQNPFTPNNGQNDSYLQTNKNGVAETVQDDVETYRGISDISRNDSRLTLGENNILAASKASSLISDSGRLLLRKSSTDGVSTRINNTDDSDDNLLVDRDAMFDPTIHLPHAPQDWKGYEPATPLSEFLMQRIGVSGQPITTAEYMRHALTHPLYGYYTSSPYLNKTHDNDDDWDADDYDEDDLNSSSASCISTPPIDSSVGRSTIFGRSGDFITAPELSSVFGHSLCVWFMTAWKQLPLEKSSNIQLVEFGPGRGTLIADILLLAHSSKLIEFGQSIRSVHLIESSRELRLEQQETLQKVIGHLVRLEFCSSGNKEDDNDDNKNICDKDSKQKIHETNTESFVNTIRIEWHDDFTSFQSKYDKNIPIMVMMQEFIDALPVHQFQKTEDGWRERMIDVVSADAVDTKDQSDSQLIPRLRQVLAPQVTPALDLFMSPNSDQYDQFPEGTVVEVCPEAIILVQDLARALEESYGAALIIDYGEEGTTDTIRAFSRHRQIPMTSRPGLVDVTADVDFFALKNCLFTSAVPKEKSDLDDNSDNNNDHNGTNTSSSKPSSIHTFGPVSQGEFLMRMGAGELTMNAIEKEETTDDQAQALADALKYFVMPEHMGEKFKVLALSRKREGLFGPAGLNG